MIRKILQAILFTGVLVYGYFFLSGSDLQPEFVGAGLIGLFGLIFYGLLITNKGR